MTGGSDLRVVHTSAREYWRRLKLRWYYFDFHAKVTSPTDFTLRVNGTEVVSLSPPVMSQRPSELLMFGWPNGCGRETWGVDAWFDGFVLSSRPVSAPSEVWLCPTADETDMSRCVWQFQESISDTSESFTFRKKGGRNTIKPGTRYIMIRNQKRQSSAGLAVSVS